MTETDFEPANTFSALANPEDEPDIKDSLLTLHKNKHQCPKCVCVCVCVLCCKELDPQGYRLAVHNGAPNPRILTMKEEVLKFSIASSGDQLAC